MSRNRRFASQSGKAAAAAILLSIGLPGAGSAANPDTSEWRCESCPFQSGYIGDYTTGVTAVTSDDARFGSGNGYDDNGMYVNLDGNGSLVRDDYRMRWTLEDLALDSRSAVIEGGNPGRYAYEFTWRDLPYRQFDTTETVLRQTGDAVLTLPSDWVRAPTTAGMSALASSLVGTRIESDRRVIGLGGEFNALAGVDVFASYRWQHTDGTDFSAGAGFTSAAQLGRPFDYETNEVNLGVRYTGDRGYLSLAWYGSFFDHDTLGFTWDNPFTVVPGAETSVSAQPPKNSFQQISLSGNYRFAGGDTVAGFSAAVGRADQDDSLLPYTNNPTLAVDPLPRGSLDGKIDTTNLALKLSARPHPKLRARVTYRYDDRDNRTAVAEYTRVLVDAFDSGEAEVNTPYSFRRQLLEARGDFDFADNLRVSGGLSRRQMDRTLQEVSDQDEDTGWAQLRWRPGTSLDVRARGGTSNRDVNNYDTDLAQTLGQNPLLRKYNQAYRYREFGELTVAAMHPERPLAGTLNVLVANDRYKHSQLGLSSSDDLRAAADISWSFSDTASLYVSAGYESIESRQAGSESFAVADWTARNDDDFKTFGAGLNMTDVADNFDVKFDYSRADGTGRVSLDSGAGALDHFPDLKSRLDALRLQVTWRKSARLDVLATFRLENVDSDDWALEGVDPDTIPTILALGADPYDYDVLLFSLGFRYALGGTDSVD